MITTNPPAASYDVCKNVASALLGRTRHRPTLGLVIGSGLSDVANAIQERTVIKCKDVEGFPISAYGEKGKLIFGTLGGKTVVCMQSRMHAYEGYQPSECSLPVRIMKLLGVETLLLANGAGGLNSDYHPGDIMIIVDHICLPALIGLNPLVGSNDERFGVRFPDMANCYSPTYIDLIKLSAARLNMGWCLRQGVYVMVSGPAYCTNAESKFLKICGGDAVGMSNCWEVMAARHCGMKVLAMCVITDTFKPNGSSSHHTPEEIQGGPKRALADLTRLLVETIPKL